LVLASKFKIKYNIYDLFFLKRRMSNETKINGSQTILGTPYYLSPEMVFLINKINILFLSAKENLIMKNQMFGH